MPLAADRIAIHARNPRLGKIAMQLLFHLLRSRADEIQILAPALRAHRRHLLRVIAVVAQHAPVAPVIGQRDRAIHAFQPLAAGAARDEARKPAPVEQQHGLLAALQALVDGLHQAPRKRRQFARLQELLPHVDHFDVRHGPLLDALGQFDQRVFAAFGVVAAFQAGRGRPEHHHGAGLPRAHDGDVPAVVARRLLLFVAVRRALRRSPPAPDSAPARRRPSACPPPPSQCPRESAAIARRARRRGKRSAESRRDRRSDGRTGRPPRASARSPAPAATRSGRARWRRRSTSDTPRSCPIL